jgi:hypothetical protein
MMYAAQMEIQVKSEEMVVRFWNQVNTVVEPAEADMYVKQATAQVMPTQ